MKMLIVEDDPIYSELITRHFTGLADEIVCVHDWTAAAEYLKKSFAVYWIDVFVPGHGPEETFLRVGDIRKHNPDSTILVVTGYPSSDLSARALASGADLFAHKLDAATQAQVIALLQLALLRTADRGVNVSSHLSKAQSLLHDLC